MTQVPIFTVYSTVKNAHTQTQWLRDIFDLASRHVNSDPKYPAEYWPGSMIRIDCKPEMVSVLWSEFVSISRFESAFNSAWDELGDDRPVEHLSTDAILDN